MVRLPIKEIDIKKMKMAKEVLAVLEILGIGENDLDNLVEIRTLREEINNLNARIKQLEEFKERTIKSEKVEATGGKITNSYSEAIKKSYKGGVEEYERRAYKIGVQICCKLRCEQSRSNRDIRAIS